MDLSRFDNELEEYMHYAVRFLSSQGVDFRDAEEAVQDVLVKILEADVEIEPAKLRAYIVNGAYHKFVDKARRNQKYQGILKDLQEGFSDIAKSPMEVMQEKEADDERAYQINLQERFFTQLKPRQADILRLKYYHDYSIKQLAEEFGCSESKMKSDAKRARDKLRKLMEKERWELLGLAKPSSEEEDED